MITLASFIRKIAFLLPVLRSNLKDALKAISLDSDTPEVIKTGVKEIMTETITEKRLIEIHDRVKESIKALKNPERKDMLRYIVLKPIQVELGKLNPVDLDQPKRKQYIRDMVSINSDEALKQKYSEGLMVKDLGKGTPSKQIRHSKSLS